MSYKKDREWILNLPDKKQVRLLKYMCEQFFRLMTADTDCIHDILKKRATKKGTIIDIEWLEIRKLINQRYFPKFSELDCISYSVDCVNNDVIFNSDAKKALELKNIIKSSFVIKEEDLYLLRDISEKFSRLTAGQLWAIHDTFEKYIDFSNPKSIKSKWDDEWKLIENKLRNRYFPELLIGSSYGIGSKEISKDSHRAWDLYQSIRKPIHLKNIEEELCHSQCTHCYQPMKTSDCELAELKEYNKQK